MKGPTIMTTTTTPELTIHIAAYGGWNWQGPDGGTGYVKVTFEGPTADAMAATYIETHLHLVIDVDESSTDDWNAFPLTMAALFPLCEHQMSADLCYGPMHYPTDDQL